MSHATGSSYLKGGILPHMWCSGCGIGIVLAALLRTFEELGYEKNNTVLVTGIGCTGKSDDYLVTNALHVTHGRALTFATGIKAFNPALNVVVLMGDGDSVTIGGNHFIHSARRNIDLTAIVVNNFNYGMTGGQVSGTTPFDHFTTTTSWGNPERGFDICELAMAAGANYVARATTYHGFEMQANFREALQKKGFSVVEAFSPCPTHYGKHNDMKAAVQMLRWLKEKALPLDSYNQLAPHERQGFFPIGKLREGNAPDFSSCYEEMRRRALDNDHE